MATLTKKTSRHFFFRWRAVRHALEDCTMLRRYYAKLGLPDDDAKKRGANDRDDNKDEGFPEVHNAFMIFGRPLACLTARQQKRER